MKRSRKAILIRNAGPVLKKAWSVRLMALAAVLSGLEVGLPIVDQIATIPQGLFAIASIVVTAGAFAARFIVQDGVSE